MLKKVVSSVLLVTLLSGCAGIMERLQQGNKAGDKDQTVAEGAVQGGVTGALLGALVGYAIDGERGAKTGAIIGAGVGLIGGAAYGNHVANQRAKFASEEEYLNACITEADQYNKKLRQYNAALQDEIATLRAQVNQLVDAYNRGKVTKADLQDAKKTVDARHAEAQQALKRTQDEVKIQKEVYQKEQRQSKQQLAQLDGQIKQLEQSAAELERQTQELAGISQRM